MNTYPRSLKESLNHVVEQLKPAELIDNRKLKSLRNLSFDEANHLFNYHFGREAALYSFEVVNKESCVIMNDGDDLLVIDWEKQPNAKLMMAESRDLDDEESDFAQLLEKQVILPQDRQKTLELLLEKLGYETRI